MTKRLILAITILLSAILPAKAEDNIPITLETPVNGSVWYLPESAAPGAWVDFATSPNNGYEVDEIVISAEIGIGTWIVGFPFEVVVPNRQYGFYMPSDCICVKVEVTFKKKKYTITVSDAIVHGSVELLSANEAEFDDVIQLKVTPANDFLVDAITVKREDEGANVPVSSVSKDGTTEYVQFTMPRSNVTVSATFKPVPRYVINIIDSDYGTVTSDVATARVGDKVTLTIKNNPGCMFAGISVVAGYPLTTSGGGAHAPSVRNKAASMWYQQQKIEVYKTGDNTYEFTLPEHFDDLLTPNYQDDTEFRVIGEFKCVSPAVMWCEGSNTLYFAYYENPTNEIKVGDRWNDDVITKLWCGDIIANTGWASPGWSSDLQLINAVKKVVFDESFANLMPKSCYRWFCNFNNLTDIEGIENLNTSEVTNMNSMFYGCTSLKTLNLNGFDMSKVTNTTSMFRACSELTTIFCDSTWNIATSGDMFMDDTKLVGAVSFDSSKTNASMANPVTGYFTSSQPITLVLNGNGTVDIAERVFPGETVTFTVTPNPYGQIDGVSVATTLSGEEVEYTSAGQNYTFTMPGQAVTVTVNITTPEEAAAVLWCEDNTTLYFVKQSTELLLNGMWDGHPITKAWGNKVDNMGWTRPGWTDVNKQVTTVVFDDSFASVRPKSCYAWLYLFSALSTIEGLNNLNTSEVTNTNSMFQGCKLLTSLDLNSFDMSKVSNSTGMFRSCSALTTIYCENTWSISTAPGMFLGCTQLVGAVPYDSDHQGADMANPLTGYFTRLGTVTVSVDESGPGTLTCDVVQAYTGTVVTITSHPASERALMLDLAVTGNVTGNKIETIAGDNAGQYTFVMPGEDVTVTARFVQLDYTLAEALQLTDGTELNLVEPLYVAAKVGSHAYVADHLGNWARLDLDDEVSVSVGDCINHFDCVLTRRDTAPTFVWQSSGSVSISHDGVETDLQVVDLVNEFDMPKPSEVIEVSGYFYNGELRGLENGKGQSLTLATDFLQPNLKKGNRYRMLVGIELKEPWNDAAQGGAPRRARSSYDFDFQNLTGQIISVVDEQIVTGIEAIGVDADEDGMWYTIDGRLLGGKPAAPGIYIHAGSKVLVK